MLKKNTYISFLLLLFSCSNPDFSTTESDVAQLPSCDYSNIYDFKGRHEKMEISSRTIFLGFNFGMTELEAQKHLNQLVDEDKVEQVGYQVYHKFKYIVDNEEPKISGECSSVGDSYTNLHEMYSDLHVENDKKLIEELKSYGETKSSHSDSTISKKIDARLGYHQKRVLDLMMSKYGKSDTLVCEKGSRGEVTYSFFNHGREISIQFSNHRDIAEYLSYVNYVDIKIGTITYTNLKAKSEESDLKYKKYLQEEKRKADSEKKAAEDKLKNLNL